MKGKSTKSLNCKICGEEVKNVGADAEKVTCSMCVSKSMRTGISIIDDVEPDAPFTTCGACGGDASICDGC